MNKLKYLKYILIVTMIFGISCDDDNDSPINMEESNWKLTTNARFTPVEDKETFIWYHDLLSGEDYWGIEEVELHVNIDTKENLENFSKIDFYIVAEEKDGYNYTEPFDTNGKLLSSSNISSSESIVLKFKASDVYDMFKNEFHKNRDAQLAMEGDIFLIHWIITNNDGSTLDSRELLDVGLARYMMKVLVQDYAPPIWEGEFDFEWIECSGGAVNWGGVFVGKTGTVTITNEGGGKYFMSNLLWDYYYGTAGYIYFDFLSGLTYVEGNSQEKWIISNIDGPSMDIEFWYSYTDAYDESGTVRFTRTDGNDWPTNIYTE